MKKSLALSALVLTLLTASSAFAASTKSGISLPVGGNFVDATGGNGTFAGSFLLQSFAVENNVLVGKGILTGTMTSSTGQVLGSVMRQIAMPVSFPGASATKAGLTKNSSSLGPIETAATCEILHLDLGPLALNLLGLNVNLSEVVLDINAQTGAGNLLGNLLCAVTNLLNGAGTLVDVANVLNQILGALSGILGGL